MSKERPDIITPLSAIRALGWSVAVHNYYRQDGRGYTFWLFTKGEQCRQFECLVEHESVRMRELLDRICRGRAGKVTMTQDAFDALQTERAWMADAIARMERERSEAQAEMTGAEETIAQLQAETEGGDSDIALLEAKLSDAERERGRMMEALTLCDPEGHRQVIHSPQDAGVGELCERIGYGAVMDAAARLWRRKDPIGAFTCGPCVLTVRDALGLPRSALTPLSDPRK